MVSATLLSNAHGPSSSVGCNCRCARTCLLARDRFDLRREPVYGLRIRVPEID
jgi:hypothetical protein